jgi:hypothetical protein
MFRNRIINGDMRIDQRNSGASVTPVDGQYTLDRWFFAMTQASKFTSQQNQGSVTPPSGYTKYLGVTSSSAYSVAAGDIFRLTHAIEGFNVADLGWGTADAKAVTISFWIRSSLTGTFGGSLINSAANRSYPFTYIISSANTWEQKTITVAGDTTGTWLSNNGVGIRINFGLGVGSTFSGTAGAWAAGNFTSATGSQSVVGTNGATFYLTGVQLEVGSKASAFERRPYGMELDLCEYYYQVVDCNGGAVNLYPNTSIGYFQLPYKTMRAIPSGAGGVVFDASITNGGSIYWNAVNGVCTYNINAPASRNSISASLTRTAGTFGAGEVCGHTYVRLRLSAEL